MYVHRILSLLTWFPEFTAKHGFRYRRILLVLLFQPAICYTDNVSPQNCPFTRDLDSGPLSSTWFLGPTRVHTPKRHLDRFSRFCTAQGCNHRPTNGQTDRQTDRPCYSVCNNRPHLHSREMRLNNKLCNIEATDGINTGWMVLTSDTISASMHVTIQSC